jgi:ATP-binding protein involved in chromosome partitioning
VKTREFTRFPEAAEEVVERELRATAWRTGSSRNPCARRHSLSEGGSVSYLTNVKGYHDIAGDGGSRVLEQVAEQRARITGGLAGVRHLVAVGSGKGGVGKSTLTLHLAGALRARGLRIAILDADFNGPSQARMAGVQGAVFVPPPLPKGVGVTGGSPRMALPRTTNGIAVFSMGSVIPESEALDFESAARGESHTWRATREFALLGEILGSVEWGALDLLLFDLPPGAERTVQYADFLGPFDGAQGRPRVSFLLVTIPSEVSRGVVARSVAALSKGSTRVLGYVENMSGYYCGDCNAIKPLFASSGARPSSPLELPCLGTIPFDPELARHCDSGIPLAELPDTPVGRALDQVAQQLLDSLEFVHASREPRPDMEPQR